MVPSAVPSAVPSPVPTVSPSKTPSNAPTASPTISPSNSPTITPTMSPTYCDFSDTNFRLIFLGGYRDIGFEDNWCYEYKLIKRFNINNHCTFNNNFETDNLNNNNNTFSLCFDSTKDTALIVQMILYMKHVVDMHQVFVIIMIQLII